MEERWPPAQCRTRGRSVGSSSVRWGSSLSGMCRAEPMKPFASRSPQVRTSTTTGGRSPARAPRRCAAVNRPAGETSADSDSRASSGLRR
ncbi:hypothetical protein STANM309S_02854 [Streptomyces tanashiensis]